MSYAGSSFAKWYIAKLKAYPLLTNMGSAVVLMTTGDVLAQELEVSGYSDKALQRPSDATANGSRSSDIDMHRYGSTVSLSSDLVCSRSAVRPRQHQQQQQNVIVPSTASSAMHPPCHPLTVATSAAAGTDNATAPTFSVSSLCDAVRKEFAFWNPSRTGTMVAWSVGVYTPFFLFLYRMYDQYLPKRTFQGIAARICLSFLSSIPVNAAFYTYGTVVNHTMEWMAIQQQWKHELADMGLLPYQSADYLVDLPLDWETMLAKCQLKIQNELMSTIVTSAQVWIPVNFVNFTFVPPHLQPLSLMIASMFWNCYLSLSQHRDIAVPDREAVPTGDDDADDSDVQPRRSLQSLTDDR